MSLTGRFKGRELLADGMDVWKGRQLWIRPQRIISSGCELDLSSSR